MDDWFDTEGLMPHGVCLSWDPDLIAAMVVSNALIATAYMTLTLILTRAARTPEPGVPRWVYWSFAAFIFSCGLTHVLDDATLWLPVYRLQAAVLCMTALISVFAAVLPITIWVKHEARRWRR